MWLCETQNHILSFTPIMLGEGKSDCANDAIRLQALGAHIEVLRGAIYQRADALDVWVPATIRAHVGV